MRSLTNYMLLVQQFKQLDTSKFGILLASFVDSKVVCEQIQILRSDEKGYTSPAIIVFFWKTPSNSSIMICNYICREYVPLQSPQNYKLFYCMLLSNLCRYSLIEKKNYTCVCTWENLAEKWGGKIQKIYVNFEFNQYPELVSKTFFSDQIKTYSLPI